MNKKHLSGLLLAIFIIFIAAPSVLACCPPKTVTVTVHYSKTMFWSASDRSHHHFEGIDRIWTASLVYYCTIPKSIKVDVNNFYTVITGIWLTNQFPAPFSNMKPTTETVYVRTGTLYTAGICGRVSRPVPVYSWLTRTVHNTLTITVQGLPGILVVLTP